MGVNLLDRMRASNSLMTKWLKKLARGNLQHMSNPRFCVPFLICDGYFRHPRRCTLSPQILQVSNPTLAIFEHKNQLCFHMLVWSSMAIQGGKEKKWREKVKKKYRESMEKRWGFIEKGKDFCKSENAFTLLADKKYRRCIVARSCRIIERNFKIPMDESNQRFVFD